MNRNRLCFTFMSWNVRGLGQSNKCDLVRDTISITHPHVICLQETKLSSLSCLQARSFLPATLNTFLDLPANGTKGGILTAWNNNNFSLTTYIHRTHSLTTHLTSTSSDYSLFVTNVYAPTDHRDTDIFLLELLEVATYISGPWLLIGDFNLTRSSLDKNTSPFNHTLAAAFNSVIDQLGLLDRQYTCTNKRRFPTLARLDRAFVNTTLSATFPNTLLTSTTAPTSDHVPILVNLDTNIPKPVFFRFERS
ncbi:unnamed protein product [Urochloa humidicola]